MDSVLLPIQLIQCCLILCQFDERKDQIYSP